MFFVVVTHCMCSYTESGNGGVWCEYLWILTLTYTMPLFMIISGFFYKERSIKYLFKNYLWPCILFSFVNFIAGYFTYPTYHNITLGYLISKTPALYAMWYVWVLFVYGIITPYLLKLLNIKKLLLLSYLVAMLSEIFGTQIFHLSRIFGFFPFYALGIYLTSNKEQVYEFNAKKKVACLIVFSICIIIYCLGNTKFAGIAQSSNFNGLCGLSLLKIMGKIFHYIMCTIMSISIIGFIPNKKICISKMGAKTMDCYYWHMTLVFLICWGICATFRCEWYGYVLNMVCVPLLSILLYSKPIDKITNKLLFK